MSITKYIGEELDLFSQAKNWKRYYANRIRPRIGDRVLEVGAGQAETTPWMCHRQHRKWICLEPDTVFCKMIRSKISSNRLPSCCSVYNGTTGSLKGRSSAFDTILYIDVLEHIEDDQGELQRAERLLSKEGEIVVLSPAHDFLFSEFDRKIGHFRRYNKFKMQQVCPRELSIVKMEYLDSVGMLASLVNCWLLKQSTPTRRQIELWDRLMVRISEIFDPLLGHTLGKSLLTILRRNEF